MDQTKKLGENLNRNRYRSRYRYMTAKLMINKETRVDQSRGSFIRNFVALNLYHVSKFADRAGSLRGEGRGFMECKRSFIPIALILFSYQIHGLSYGAIKLYTEIS